MTMARLQVSDGTTQRLVEVRGDRAAVGRSPDNDVVLDTEATISRYHAVVERTPDGWAVRDLDSRNGTAVNGTRITGSVELTPQDTVRIGPFTLSLRTEGQGLSETADASTLAAAKAVARYQLTARELDVLRLVARGDSDQQIAEHLYISVKTVQSHLDRIRGKIGLRRRPDLVRFVAEHQLY